MRVDGPSGDIHDEIGGVDKEGFVPFATLRELAASLGQEKFTKRYPAPAIHFLAQDAESLDSPTLQLTDSEISFKRTMVLPLHGDAKRYHNRLAFLVKGPGRPFPNMVSIGRALNSDIVLSLETISKFHGYFMKEKTGWFFVDGKTTNGSHVNGRRMKPGEKHVVNDGDEVALGLEVRARFLLPATLFARLRAGS
jgi:hypothetical protein